MKANFLINVSFALAILSGCAGQALKAEWTQRGYTDAEIAEVGPYQKSYMEILSQGTVNSNQFNTTEKVNAENRVRTIFCACAKKLKEKCQKKPDGLTGEDRTLCAKANGAESALIGMAAAANPLQTSAGKIDTAECN